MQTKVYGKKALANTLRPLVDIVSDPLAPCRRPTEWQQAKAELDVILADDRHWEKMEEILPGCTTNFFLRNIGRERFEWMRQYRRDELKKGGGNGAS